MTLPVPLPSGYRLGDDDMDPARYAPDGLELPEWAEVVASGLAAQVIREAAVTEWSERVAWANKARRTRRCT